jgi:ParB-like chromosome segregation protein Spo0J
MRGSRRGHRGGGEEILKKAESLRAALVNLDFEDRVQALNSARAILAEASPFSSEPVDVVRWEPVSNVHANDYNPNSVAPPEMTLLEHSIMSDGYTQPIVVWEREDGTFEVVDGFHRNRVARESIHVAARVQNHLPLSVIKKDREGRGDRIAATIRHNRARGKHRIDAMSEIVIELKRRNWSDTKIGKELGMDPDEVLRLAQISGLAEMFSDADFSEAWEADVLFEKDESPEVIAG